MEVAALCAVLASLRVVPNKSQFFQYESISISCGEQENSSEWRVKRNTSSHINTTCPSSSYRIDEAHCSISDLYPGDSGVYWCESAAGECFDAISINVTAGSVILESPVHPVMEGDTVTLHCRHRAGFSSNFTATFYKNGDLIGTSSTGHLTIHRVSKSDEGLYKCNIAGDGQSPVSLLTVNGFFCHGEVQHELPHSTLARILPAIFIYFSLVSVLLFSLMRIHKDKIDPSVVLYTEVTTKLNRNRKGESPRTTSSLFSSEASYRLDCT